MNYSSADRVYIRVGVTGITSVDVSYPVLVRLGGRCLRYGNTVAIQTE